MERFLHSLQEERAWSVQRSLSRVLERRRNPMPPFHVQLLQPLHLFVQVELSANEVLFGDKGLIFCC